MRQLWCVRADLFSCHAIWGGWLVQGDQEMQSVPRFCVDGGGRGSRFPGWMGLEPQVPRPACAWRICLMFSAEESRFLPCGHCEACGQGGSSVRACALRHRRLGVIVEVMRMR